MHTNELTAFQEFLTVARFPKSSPPPILYTLISESGQVVSWHRKYEHAAVAKVRSEVRYPSTHFWIFAGEVSEEEWGDTAELYEEGATA